MIPAGIILVGEEGDTIDRPAWAQDGSFLAFRQLAQLVPEFNQFLADNALLIPGINTTEGGRELLGARMMGRWKSVSMQGGKVIAQGYLFKPFPKGSAS